MEAIIINQITTKEIEDVVRAVLTEFYETSVSRPHPDNNGGIELAIEITGLAKPTIYSLVSRRLIPHSKRGKKLYFSRAELTSWIADGRRKTRAEIALAADKS